MLGKDAELRGNQVFENWAGMCQRRGQQAQSPGVTGGRRCGWSLEGGRERVGHEGRTGPRPDGVRP